MPAYTAESVDLSSQDCEIPTPEAPSATDTSRQETSIDML